MCASETKDHNCYVVVSWNDVKFIKFQEKQQLWMI